VIARFMDRLRGMRFRIITALRPERAWQELDEEMRFHVQMEADRLK
jgi:hypothetical protein